MHPENRMLLGKLHQLLRRVGQRRFAPCEVLCRYGVASAAELSTHAIPLRLRIIRRPKSRGDFWLRHRLGQEAFVDLSFGCRPRRRTVCSLSASACGLCPPIRRRCCGFLCFFSHWSCPFVFLGGAWNALTGRRNLPPGAMHLPRAPSKANCTKPLCASGTLSLCGFHCRQFGPQQAHSMFRRRILPPPTQPAPIARHRAPG